MVKQSRQSPTAKRYLDETLALIAEKGGSREVNLREIGRRLGFAHTNVYNYYAGFDDLMWAAFRQTLQHYQDALADGLEASLSPAEYLHRLVSNLARFPQEHPGLYRFIGSDPIDLEGMPQEIADTVVTMKQWLVDAFASCAPGIDPTAAEEVCNIVYAYIDGETFNLINERVVPGEDIGGRMVRNAVRLFDLLTTQN